jgi:hypothetical protein
MDEVYALMLYEGSHASLEGVYRNKVVAEAECDKLNLQFVGMNYMKPEYCVVPHVLK